MTFGGLLASALLALPWLLATPVLAWRWRNPATLDDASPSPPPDAPPVSVIVPARNEAANVERCLTSLLAQRWPHLEVVLVDDHSSDGTGDIARRLAAADPRLCVVTAPPLPRGWFGKQWACETGARASTGELLLFTDADTWHAPDAVPRAVNLLRAERLDFLTGTGRQELGSAWEKIVQPQLLLLIAARYGGPTAINRSRRVADKIGAGHFILVRRDAYERMGGHGAVRGTVAEDLALAQLYFREGLRTKFVLAESQVTVRMYTGLADLVRGWEKNIFAGGRRAMWGGRIGQLLFPVLLPLHGLWQLAPPVALLLALGGLLGAGWLAWSALATLGLLVLWMGTVTRMGIAPVWGAAFPLGAIVYLGIVTRAILRGRRVTWKGRAYESE